MGMFETVGRSAAVGIRKENTLRERERLHRALRHEEPDRVPIRKFQGGDDQKAEVARWPSGSAEWPPAGGQ
jgi:hypothetical protein